MAFGRDRHRMRGWRRGAFLGIFILLLSLCHGSVNARAAATEFPGNQITSSLGSEDGASHSTGCVSRAKAIAPLAKRISSSGNVQPIIEPLLWLATRGESNSVGFAFVAPPSSGDLRALLQVFRI